MLVIAGVGLWQLAEPLAALADAQAATPGRILCMALELTLFLWLLRVAVRLFLARSHPSVDATERAVIVETYIAPLKGGAVSKEQRQLVLAAVFRHAPSGLIKDDAGPHTPLDLLARVIGR
jgi:hypothetical protein